MYDTVLLSEILSHPELKLFNENGKIQSPSHEVYNVVAKCMTDRGSPISPKHVYVILNEDRHKFLTKLRITRGVIEEESAGSEISESFHEVVESDTFSNSQSTKTLEIVISIQQWNIIKPARKVYGKRVNWRLQSGWTDIIAKELWKQHSIDCVLSFKYNDVRSSSASYYVKLKGECSECGGTVVGVILDKPLQNEPVIVKCKFFNVLKDFHSGVKKRHLRGVNRNKIGRRMIKEHLDAIMYRRSEAAAIKSFGRNSPPILPSCDVLRKAKEEQVKRTLNLNYSNPVLNLFSHSKVGKFAGAIHSISLLKFFCIYWTKEQELIYRSRCKRDVGATLTIDATGGVAKKMKGDEAPIFLYQCMLVTTEGSVPIFQMVSGDQRSLIISHFLKTILSRRLPPPRIVVSDFGRAILLSVAEVFCKCSNLNEYLQICFELIVNNSTVPPKCYIRLDVSHIIRMVGRWKCLRDRGSPVRRFFLHIIGQACQMSDLEELKHFIESVLVVCHSQYIGVTNEGSVTYSQTRIDFINKVIQGVTLEPLLEQENAEDVQIEGDNDDDNDNDVDCESGTSWRMWANSLEDSARRIASNSNDGTTINACFSPSFATSFKKQLIYFLPLWTGLMRDYNKDSPVIATSSSVEAEFRDLKSRCFRGQLPMRVDKFVMQHLQHIDAKILLKSNVKDAPSPNAITITEDDSSVGEEVELNIEENWRGLLTKIPSVEIPNVMHYNKIECTEKTRKKKTYLDKCPEWELIKDVKVANIPMFVNGMKCPIIKLGSQSINVTQTCAFDSTFQIVLNSLVCNETYKECVVTSSSAIIKLALLVLHDKNIVNKHYVKRAEILTNLNLFRSSFSTYKTNITTLNAECNVCHLNECLFINEPSVSRTNRCDCGFYTQRTNVMVNVNVDKLLEEGLFHVEDAILDAVISSPRCSSCGNSTTEEIEYGPHLLIDLSVFTDKNYLQDRIFKAPSLDVIAPTVKLGGKIYVLAGVVHWSEGHYTAFVKTGSFWHLYDDLQKKRQPVKHGHAIQPHLLMYTIKK